MRIQPDQYRRMDFWLNSLDRILLEAEGPEISEVIRCRFTRIESMQAECCQTTDDEVRSYIDKASRIVNPVSFE